MSKVILLVEDDQVFRESVRDILESEDYRVIEVADGKDALQILNKENFDLLITDILMPEVEGVELAMKVRKMLPGLKIIGMTGGGRNVSSKDIEAMCGSFIFDTILHKPFLAEDLIFQVEHWIKQK